MNDGRSALGLARRENHSKTFDFLSTQGAIDDGIYE